MVDIEIDKIYTYKELCALMQQPTKAGNSKQSQLKDWKRYFEWEKITKQKYKITKIYDPPKRKKGRQEYGLDFDKVYNVKKEYENSKGVYKIQLDNMVYIGSTVKGFKNRFKLHCRGELPHTYQLLFDGGVFEPIWIAENNDSDEFIRNKEEYYIQEYYKNGFDMINRKLIINRKSKDKKRKKYYVKSSENGYIIMNSKKEILKEFTDEEWIALIS